MDGRDIVLILELHYKHNWDKIYNAIKNKDFTALDDSNKIVAEAELLALLNEGYRVLFLGDEEYPSALKKIIRPPFFIFYKGDLETVEERYFNKYADPIMISKRLIDGCFLE